jgi:hypothetical protein
MAYKNEYFDANKTGLTNGAANDRQREGDFETILRRYEERADLFLPCHYFDIIGGTSTGGQVSRTIFSSSPLIFIDGDANRAAPDPACPPSCSAGYE